MIENLHHIHHLVELIKANEHCKRKVFRLFYNTSRLPSSFRTYYIEYQFPLIVNNYNGHTNEETEVMKITSKRFESNNDITFSHLSTYPCIINETNLKTWWRSLLIFKIYSRMSGTSSPEQIGFAVLPIRTLFQANYLHFEEDLNIIDRTEMNSNKVGKKYSIGQLHLMLELDSEKQDFKTELDRIQLLEQIRPKKQRVTKSKRSKKSKKSVMKTNSHQSIPKGFAVHEPSDGLVLQIYLSIVEARNIPQASNNRNK